MDYQMKWAKKQRKYIDIDTINRKRMKTIKIITAVAAIALVAFFWSDIKGAVTSFSPGNKKDKTKSEMKMENAAEPASPGILIKKSWDMPGVLKEISGLSAIDENRFACVQDELGKIFIYNTNTSSVEKEIPFGDAGDYEGLTVVNNTIWVLRADGRLFEVENFNNKPVIKEHKTSLTAEHNVEGLCFDKANNRLLLAIKDEEPGNTDYKGIYGFDLNAKKMPEQPVYKLNYKDEAFKMVKQKKKKGGEIKPSGIAVHPTSGEIYITDGPKSKLLVLTKEGAIKKFYQLGNEFEQPEGITFQSNGELFIANEGSKKAGNILNVAIEE
jgi:DNA-binding beta-propeller fold protein YncE